MKKTKNRRIVNTMLRVTAMLIWIAAAAQAQVTAYTDEADYLAALANLDFSTSEEGFEDDAVWGSVRSSLQVTNSAPSITSRGITWTSNHPDTNNITTGGGPALTGQWGFYDPNHGHATGSVAQCDVDNPPANCFFHDGFTGTREAGAATLYGAGGWVNGTFGGKIILILDGNESNPIDFGDLGGVTATHNFFGVIDTDGFTQFEFRETEGKIGDSKFIFADDFTFGKSTSANAAAEIIGTWPSGIWYWDVATSSFTKMASDTTTGDIAAGDFTDDGKADVAGIFDSGLWYLDAATLDWTKVPGAAPDRLTAGDVTGDGRSEILGTWPSGIWYWDVATSSFIKMASDTTTGDIAAEDFTGDGKADVAGIFDSGLWYIDGATLDWTKVPGAAPDRLTAGDVTGDGRSEIIGTWPSGIWYWDVATSSFTKMASDTTTGDIAAEDFTGDGKADVAGIFDSGLWYLDAATLDWTKVPGAAPDRLTAGDVTGP